MTTKYSKQCEHKIRVQVFLPQDCIDFYIDNPKDGINNNVRNFLLKHWLENRKTATESILTEGEMESKTRG